MLSFINMGGRKKRQRKRGSRGSGAGTRGQRRTSRGSGSFMSPGNLGDFVENQAASPSVQGALGGKIVAIQEKVCSIPASTDALTKPQRSPEIQLEFRHDSLLQAFPEGFLRHRKDSSSSSLVRDARTSRPSRATESRLNLEASPQGRRLTQEKRRMPPLPSPIKIPSEPLKLTAPQTQLQTSRIRRSLASNSPVWASDSEFSPVSGLSAAREVIADFSFPARPALSAKEKEVARISARQDSATLPREAIWESSISRRNSSKSLKKRRLDSSTAGDPPSEAFVITSPHLRRKGSNENESGLVHGPDPVSPPPPPRKDSIIGHRREASVLRGPPPPGLTPSAQKLDQSDQAALHRISRIVETDAECSSLSTPQPTSGSTSGSFSSRSKKSVKPKLDALFFKVPSALSTPSTYSKYTSSPFTSPGKRPVHLPTSASSARSDVGYESFLEEYDLIEPPSGPSSRGDRSGFSRNPAAQYETQVPMTAKTFSSVNGLKSTPATGRSGFPQESPKSSISRASRLHKVEHSKHSNEPLPSVYPTPSPKGAAERRDGTTLHTRSRSGSTSSMVAVIGRLPIASSGSGEKTSQRPVTRQETSSKDETSVAVTNAQCEPPESRRVPILKLSVSGLEGVDGEKRQPRLSRFRVTNPNINSSPGSTSPLSLSRRSPDLLDMLIPDGHIITPISCRQIRRKRSGSTPSPIKIMPARDARYLPMNGDDGDEADVAEVHDGAVSSRVQPDNALSPGDIQTFPETPVMFSPDLSKDVISRPNSIYLTDKQLQVQPCSLLSAAMSFNLIAIPSTPHIIQTAESLPVGDNGDNIRAINGSCPPSASSPPISPLQPPEDSPVEPISRVQILLDTTRPSAPLLGAVPKRKNVHMRPPLPFGPRKPYPQSRKGTAPLSFTPRRAASESATSIAQNAIRSKPLAKPDSPLGTPTFKTTPVPWRGMTLEAAKWTLSSAQLQATVRVAIEQSAHASSIRLLPQDVFEELPTQLSELEARRKDIQNNYKVLVRRRRSLIQRLTLLPLNGLRADSTSVARDAEELARVTAVGDRLVEELHDVDDQISQVNRLQDVHQASALAVALRKLHASLSRQSEQTHKLQMDVMNLYAERNEAWRKAEELERELDSTQERDGSSRPKSLTSSHRSSRVSLARKNSSRTSQAGLRLSGFNQRRSSQRSSSSSLLVHNSTGTGTTFSSDVVPPVPPLPAPDPPVLTGVSSIHSSSSIPQSSAPMQSADNLYNVVYDLLGIKRPDRSMPSPVRPNSDVFCAVTSPPKDDTSNTKQVAMSGERVTISHVETTTRPRSGSLPTQIPPAREMEETNAIIARLDFHD